MFNVSASVTRESPNTLGTHKLHKHTEFTHTAHFYVVWPEMESNSRRELSFHLSRDAKQVQTVKKQNKEYIFKI